MTGHFRGQGLNRYVEQLNKERALGRVRADCRDQLKAQLLMVKKSRKLKKQNESLLQRELRRLQEENAKLLAEVSETEQAPTPTTPEEQLRARHEAEKRAKMAASLKSGIGDIVFL